MTQSHNVMALDTDADDRLEIVFSPISDKVARTHA